MTKITDRTIEFPQNREALIEKAAADFEGCISVGGLGHEFGFLDGTPRVAPRVFGKLIEFARRKLGWSAERLAEEANIDLVEVVNLELDRDFIPQPRTVAQLARRLGYSTVRLMDLAGLTSRQSAPLSAAAVRFAARSETASELTTAEREAYDQFAKALVETTDE